MWGKPQLLRILTIMLVVGSLLLLAYSALNYALQLPVFKLRTVQLTNTPQHVDVNQVSRLVKRVVGGSFFTVDLEQTRRTFEQLPWVRKVGVRRQFSWGLEVTLEEHVPIARWNNTSLVNTYGEVFEGEISSTLPEFYGEADTSALVAGMYVDLNQQLGSVQRSIVKINLSPRFSWQLKLDNGMVLALGREQMKQRLARFVAVYPYSLATMTSKVNYVDLRYRNGFSVSQVSSASGTDVVKRNLRNKV